MMELRGFRLLPQALLVCGLLHAAHSPAQAPAAPPQAETPVANGDEELPTLHAYTNLIQIPVLVLSPDLLSVPSVKPDQFSLSIDDGPSYRPTHVRPEGEDPMSVTIVLDFGGAGAELMPKISEAIGRLNPHGLTPRDHVSLTVMQCGLIDVLDDVPAAPGVLQPTIAQAVRVWAQRDKTKPCEEEAHLWDTLAMAMLRLSHLPGRRVMVAVTDGVDRGSSHTSEELAVEMPSFAVTIFSVRTEPSLRPQPANMASIGAGSKGIASMVPTMPGAVTTDPLERLCELSGGIALPADRGNAGKQFARVPELLRSRYILDFPRPSNSTEGVHKFDVRVARSDDVVRSAGITFPLPDPKLAADPTTVQSEPAETPTMGKPKQTPPPRLL